MKHTILGIAITIAVAATVFAQQQGAGQTATEPIKVRGCLQGNGSDQSPWTLRRVVLPAPPAAVAAAPAGARGGRGDGGGRGAGGGRGDGAGQAAPAADGARGAAGAGRGGDGRGAAPAAAPAPPPPPPVDLRLTGTDMTPWRNMFVEVEGVLGPRPATGLQQLRVNAARSAYGDCP